MTIYLRHVYEEVMKKIYCAHCVGGRPDRCKRSYYLVRGFFRKWHTNLPFHPIRMYYWCVVFSFFFSNRVTMLSSSRDCSRPRLCSLRLSRRWFSVCCSLNSRSERWNSVHRIKSEIYVLFFLSFFIIFVSFCDRWMMSYIRPRSPFLRYSRPPPPVSRRASPSSRDWHRRPLTPQTLPRRQLISSLCCTHRPPVRLKREERENEKKSLKRDH